MTGIIKKLVGFSGIGLIAVFSSSVHAAGYKIEFQSASVLADAGEAAVVEDAGTNWYNSAGLVYLPQQVVYSVIDVYAPTTFSGNAAAPTVLPPPFTPLGSSFAASGSASSHPNTVMPAIHYTMPLSERLAVGFTVAPAWGFKEEYGPNSLVRYNLNKVYTKTIDIAPSIAYKINNQWSVGVGPDFHYFSVQSKFRVRTEGLPPLGTPGDSIARFTASRWGYGGHAGVLFKMDECTRFGLNYRTNIYMNLQGFSSFSQNNDGFFENGSFKFPVPLPPTTTLSAYRDVTPVWALMGTLAWDQWNVIRDYHARNFAQPPSPANPAGVLPSVVLPAYYHNTVDYSIGTHYKITDNIMLRGSFKYEPTPTNSQFRDVSFPDATKYGIQIGGRYKITKAFAVDALYGHVFTRQVSINSTNPITGASVTGHNNTSIDLLGAQLVWNI